MPESLEEMAERLDRLAEEFKNAGRGKDSLALRVAALSMRLQSVRGTEEGGEGE